MKNTSRKVFCLLMLSILFLIPLSSISASSIITQGIPNVVRVSINGNQNDESLYDLLVIAPEEFEKQLQPLAVHKEKHGVATKLVTLNQVYDKIFWKGRDDAAKIKYFIKKAMEEWGIQYVLLVGGRKHQSHRENWWLPVRYSHLNRKYDEYPEKKFLSDLYFADIYDEEGHFSSWDTNHNGVYGEWPQHQSAWDTADLYPDVSVGRLPCRNRFEVRQVVQKIIAYETGECADSWFKKMMVVAGDTYPDKTDYIDGEVYTQQGLDMMPGFQPVKLWASTGSLKHWFNIVHALNQGCGFVFFSGHGSPKSWATHPPDDSSKWIGSFKVRHMAFLRNQNKLPVCISGSGCFVNMFNVSLLHSPHVYGLPTPRCWSWALTRKSNGGCIAAIGATGYSYESPDINTGNGGIEWLDMHFFEQYGLQNQDILGDAWAGSITSFLQNFSIDWQDTSDTGSALIVKNVEQWLLIGDPSLKIGGYSQKTN